MLYCLPSWFPAGYSDCYSCTRGGGRCEIYTCRYGFLSSLSSASESTDFASAGLMEKTAATACRMAPSQFYNRANEREPRIASLNFSQAFMVKKEAEGEGETRKITDFFYTDKYNLKKKIIINSKIYTSNV